MILPGSLRPWLLGWTGFEPMSPNQQMRALPIGPIRQQKNVAHNHIIAAAQLAQWDQRLSAEREAVGSNPGRTNSQGL